MDVSAFKGYRYDASVVGDAAHCVAPPYDVIDADQQEKLYEVSDFNIIRVIKGKSKADDGESDNVYTRAAAALEAFCRQGAIKQDDSERIYVYAQDFAIGRKSYRRTGFVALGKLEEYGGSIKPHEQTLAGPKADRLNLMRATKSQIGQIFVLYTDPEKSIDTILSQAAQAEPLLKHTDEDGVIHQLYAVMEPEQIQTIVEVMKDKQICIADGHHRYETALNYYQEMKHPAAAQHMMTFVNTHNEGLIVLPTHRLVKNVAEFRYPEFLRQMNEYFDVARLAFEDEAGRQKRYQEMTDGLALEMEEGNHAFGMYFADGAFYLASLRDEKVMAEISADHSDAWRKLDVAILHKLILEKMLGIDEAALTAQTNVEYIKDFGSATQRAIDRVDIQEAQVLFFLNPTRAQEVEAVAATDEKMPQKSTFFYPKIFSGLVLNRLER
jgi:uncharacterized protein (DUF1015 family)